MPSSKITFKYHEVFNDQVVRKIAFDELGDAYADHIFLCLPGLLETRSTFSTFCQLVHSQFNARTIALDYCGRGDSEALISHSNYKMSTYIKDVNDLLSHYVLKTHQNEQHTLYVVGSSMGGILAMHLCKELKHPIKGIVLNDIGLSLKWLSIYRLFNQFKQPSQYKSNSSLAHSLRVHEAVISQIKSPAHFDLDYEYDYLGMYFDSLLKAFNGPILLIHSDQSLICPKATVAQSKTLLPRLVTLTCPGQSHPVAWSDEICSWLAKGLNLKPINPRTTTGTLHVQNFEGGLSVSSKTMLKGQGISLMDTPVQCEKRKLLDLNIQETPNHETPKLRINAQAQEEKFKLITDTTSPIAPSVMESFLMTSKNHLGIRDTGPTHPPSSEGGLLRKILQNFRTFIFKQRH